MNETQEKWLEERKTAIDPLWLTDNPEWVKARKQLWRKVLANMVDYYGGSVGTAEYKKQLTQYFVYGKATGLGIGMYQHLLCTPWETESQLKILFDDPFVGASKRKDLMYLPIAYSYFYRELPEQWHRIQLFSESLWGSSYRVIESPSQSGSLDMSVISPDPEVIVRQYMKDSYQLFHGRYGSDSFTWLNCNFDYFLSCADYVNEHSLEIGGSYFRKLMKYLLQLNGAQPEFGKYQQEVFDNLYPYLMAKDAYPFILEVRNKVLAKE